MKNLMNFKNYIRKHQKVFYLRENDQAVEWVEYFSHDVWKEVKITLNGFYRVCLNEVYAYMHWIGIKELESLLWDCVS